MAVLGQQERRCVGRRRRRRGRRGSPRGDEVEGQCYCRFLCCFFSCGDIFLGRRRRGTPPAHVVEAALTNFRHDTTAKAAPSTSRAVRSRAVHVDGHNEGEGGVVWRADDTSSVEDDDGGAAQYRGGGPVVRARPPPPRWSSGRGEAWARARALECYADFVSGIDGSGRRDDGSAALLAAASVGDVALCEALLAEGFYVDARGGPRCESAVVIAARHGHREVCDLLFDRGADMTATDSQRRNAAHHARDAGFPDLAQMLHEYGAPLEKIGDAPDPDPPTGS